MRRASFRMSRSTCSTSIPAAASTYAIEAPRGSREIGVNGAAARLVQAGDKLIILAYCQLPAEETRNYHPAVVLLGDGNEVVGAS